MDDEEYQRRVVAYWERQETEKDRLAANKTPPSVDLQRIREGRD